MVAVVNSVARCSAAVFLSSVGAPKRKKKKKEASFEAVKLMED